MNEQPIYHNAEGRAYTVRDGQSVWVGEESLPTPTPYPVTVPTVAPVPGPTLEYVGFWPRAAARLIDLALIYAMAFASGIIVGFVIGFTAALSGRDAQAALDGLQAQSGASFGISLVAATIFYIIAESMHGSTPGKLILGFTVRAEDGSPCTVVQALKREIAYYVDGLVFGLPALSAMRSSARLQRIGDKWAKTVVVKTRSIPESERRSGLRFAGVTVLACAVYSALAVASIVA